MLRLVTYLLLAFMFFIHQDSMGQTRQSDSMKNKQLAYNNLKKQEAAQKKKEQLAKEKDIKKTGVEVVTYDSKGNKVEAYFSKEGKKVSTTTTIIIPAVLNRKFSVDTINVDSIYLRAVKAKNRLTVYHKGKILTAYKCVFGPSLSQKKCEGDRCTPEGTFTIQTCKDHDKWDKFMLIDYPNDESRRLFEENKRNKLIPENASIGGLVGIHGIWANGDNVIDLKHNWTDGCISIKNKDVEELSKIVKPGVTKITIVK